MRRGELYRVFKGIPSDPKKSRVFVVVSRQAVVDSRLSTVVCAPVYTSRHGLTSQVDVGMEEGLKHDCCIHCDELVSLPKSSLTSYAGMLSAEKLEALGRALMVALDLEM